MMRRHNRGFAIGVALVYSAVVLGGYLVLIGYADAASGVLSLLMITGGIWLSSKGMALLKHAETHSDAPLDALETAYRYRNAGIALGLTGSGLLVFSWQTFLARFISAAPSGMLPTF